MGSGREVVEVPTFDPLDPEPLVQGAQSYESLTRTLLNPIFQTPGKLWWTLFGLASAGVCLLVFAIVWTLIIGIDAWGNNIPVAWGFGITNFVWWIGFAHAGTLISAILVLFQQKWRAPIHRFAEAMALASITQAGIYPLLHLGRPWFSYWLTAYPTVLNVWPQFKSSLTWDIAAVTAYLFVTAMFWYTGMIPDLATARDHAPTRRRQMIYAVLAMGWTGTARQWHQWKTAYALFAGIGTALVLSVESIVSFDFAIGIEPGWHELVFPPYFVASAMFSGFALLLVMILPTRRAYGLEQIITRRHIDLLAKMVLLFSFFTLYGFYKENFFPWYRGEIYELSLQEFKRHGSYAPLWYLEMLFSAVAPQVLWVPKLRKNGYVLWTVCLLIVFGAWFEQFMHVIPTLSHDYLPSVWEVFKPTWVDWSLLFGTISLFAFLMLLFGRFVPPVAVSEVKEVFRDLRKETAKKAKEEEKGPPVEVGA